MNIELKHSKLTESCVNARCNALRIDNTLVKITRKLDQ